MSYIDTFDIAKAIAPATYSKSPGKIVELDSGLKKNRLKFELHSNDTSTQVLASVYVEVIGNGFFECSKSFILSIMSIMHLKFIKATYRGKTIYININSLTSRLGIKVEKTYSEKIFHSELKKHLETEKKMDIFFQKIIKEKYIEDDNELRTTNGKLISKAYFRKLLGLTAFSMFNSVQEQESSYLLKDGNILFLKKEKDKEWPLLTLFTKNVLGEGSFGVVLVVKELSMGRLSIAKIAHNSAFNEDIKNEDLILSTIFNNSNPVGIQRKPYSLFNNLRLEDTNYSGYIAPKYDSSLNSIMQKLKADEKIEATRQLLKRLQELEKQQISHGDIKEANCLFQRKSDASIECVIADFGGATDLSKQAEWSYGTCFYELEKDYTAYQSLCKQRNSEKTKKGKDKLNTDLIKVLLRRDVYAMGITLTNLLADSKVKNKKNLCSLINQMLEVSWEKRISASEALAKFEKIFPRQVSSV